MADGAGGEPVEEATSLGRSFRLLLSGSVISNVGDGLAFTAFPLLAAALTRDPLSIALVTAAGTLPFAVVGLFGGVIVDRSDRRRVLVVTDSLRTLVVVALVACVTSHHVGVAGLAGFAAAIGVGGCLFNIASQAILPSLVGIQRRALGRANGRLFGSEVFGVQLVGPAIGGAVFATSRSLPFTLDAISFAASAALAFSIRGSHRVGSGGGARESVFGSIRTGVAYVVHSRLLRTFTLTIAGVNLAAAAQEAVLVILAERRLGLGPTGYGLLFAALAVGGLLATALSDRYGHRWHEATVLRFGFGLLPLGAVIAGLAPDAVVCGVGLAFTSFGLMTVNVVAGPLRQSIIPADLLGRVYAAATLLGRAALPVGAVLGGSLAEINPRLPFLVAAALGAAALFGGAHGMSRRVIDHERSAAAA